MTTRVVPREAFALDADIVPGEVVPLRASRCAMCGRTEFPARLECPACGAPSPEISLPTEGRLCGFTSVLHSPPGAAVEVPYHVGVVELDGAIRVMGLLEDPPADLAVGLPVQTVAAIASEDLITYAFRVV